MNPSKPIHPFPARMAPEIALNAMKMLPQGSVVLDPMMGSGTVIRAAIESGHSAVGFDVDPLAKLMSQVWTTPINTERLKKAAASLIFQALSMEVTECPLPWIDGHSETSDFLNYWFATKQKHSLRRLAHLLKAKRGPIANALRLGLSRIIVTKSRGASLAGDISHSRPHRIRETNDFSVFDEYLKAIEKLAHLLETNPVENLADLNLGDARRLNRVENTSIDAVITSPPYLNAIDYLRGHRLALIWFGYDLERLRKIRAGSVGAERGLNDNLVTDSTRNLVTKLDHYDELTSRYQKILMRYAYDICRSISEAFRVLRPGGTAIYVLGNSCLQGIFVQNTKILQEAASNVGLDLIDIHERKLPPNKRYLPPPGKLGNSSLRTRMRTEAVLKFLKPKSGYRTVDRKMKLS